MLACDPLDVSHGAATVTTELHSLEVEGTANGVSPEVLLNLRALVASENPLASVLDT